MSEGVVDKRNPLQGVARGSDKQWVRNLYHYTKIQPERNVRMQGCAKARNKKLRFLLPLDVLILKILLGNLYYRCL